MNFDTFFSEIYGHRWNSLKAALSGTEQKIDVPLQHANTTYRLDLASRWVSDQIPWIENGRYLDLCAAPGGKSLLALDRFWGRNFTWLANEKSKDRFFRMKALMDPYLKPSLTGNSNLSIHQWDGEKAGLYHKDSFDFILVDAPCSSERHLIEQGKIDTDWTPSRTKSLSKRQYSLVCSALLALKPKGTLFYSTCSISPFENDAVIERVRKKKSELIDDSLIFPDQGLTLGLRTERTRYGLQCFPDQNEGAGPIYMAILTKNFTGV